MNFYVYQYFELLALVIALIHCASLKTWGIQLFVPLLLLDSLTELIGNNFQLFNLQNSYFIYNIYLIISTPLQLYLFKKMLDLNGPPLNIFKILFLIIMVFVLSNFVFLEGFWLFNSYTLILVEVINIVFACLVLFKISMEERRTPTLFRHPFFWINAAILLFSIMALVLLGLQRYLIINHIIIGNKTLYYAILPTANIALYLGYSYGFILCRQKEKS